MFGPLHLPFFIAPSAAPQSVTVGTIASGSALAAPTVSTGDKSVHFTRASDQYLSRATPFDYNSNYTVCGWFRRDAINQWATIVSISNNTSANADWLMCVGGASGNTNHIGLFSDKSGLDTLNIFGATATVVSTWYFAALVRSGTTVSLYLGTTPSNVAVDASGTADMTGRTAATALRLGEWAVVDGTSAWNGDMARWRCFTRALTLSELQAEACTATPASTSNLWADWKLPNPSDLTDYSGNSRPLTANNGPLTTGVEIAQWNYPPAIASATTLTPPTVAPGAVTVAGGTRASTLVLNAPTLAVGAVAVTGGTRASTLTLNAPAVAAGAVAITAGTVASGSTLYAPAVEGLAVVVLPNATIAAGGWVDHLGGTTDLHTPLADSNPATWDQSPFNPAGEILKLGLTNTPTPGVGDKLVLSIDASQI